MSSNLIWLPETAKEALCIDTSVADIETTLIVNQSLVNWLNGKLDTGTLTDVLLQFQIDPQFLDNFESCIHNLLKQSL